MGSFNTQGVNISKVGMQSSTVNKSNFKTVVSEANYNDTVDSFTESDIVMVDFSEIEQQNEENSNTQTDTNIDNNSRFSEVRTAAPTRGYGDTPASKPPPIKVVALNPQPEQPATGPTGEEIVQAKLAELDNKTIESTRPAEGDERAIFTELTTYTDGTEVQTGLNQAFFPGAVKRILVHKDNNVITEDFIFEGRDDGMVHLEQTNQIVFEDDPLVGQTEQNVPLEVKKTYQNRDDGLIQETSYPSVEEGLYQVLRYENVTIYNVKIDGNVVQMSEEEYKNSGY